MDTQVQKLMFSSKSNEWETPEDFYNKLNQQFKFTLDPCATHENHKCKKYYTMEDDGLSKSWENERVFVNPPYGNIGEWIKKAYKESTQHNAIVVMLIPARTDTKYWHDYIMQSASKIYFIKGRLKFKNKVIADYTGKSDLSPAPFPSVVVVFGGLRWSPGPVVSSLDR
jgi:site-specific DNA-methyltransferase (adenine-specific)